MNELVNDDSIIICLGLGCIDIDSFSNNIIKYDSESDYTKKWSLNKIKNHFNDQYEIDRFNYEYCKCNNIKYYNTNIDREKIITKILEEIKAYCE